MDATTLIGAVLVAGAAIWPAYQLWRAVFGQFARKDDVDTLKADVAEIKDTMHSLRNKLVTREEFRDHEDRDEQDRKERRENEISIFNKIDELKDGMNGKFDRLTDLIIQGRK